MNKKCKICGCDNEIIVNGICRDCIDELQRKSEDAEIESYLKGHNDKVDSLQSQLAAAQERIAELEELRLAAIDLAEYELEQPERYTPRKRVTRFFKAIAALERGVNNVSLKN